MTKSELRYHWAAVRKAEMLNCDAFIAAGRGHEKPSEYLAKTDPLAMEAQQLYARKMDLAFEAEKLLGPSWKYMI